MTAKQMRQMGIDPDDFECILDEEDILGGYFDDCLVIDDDEEE